jgi:hypothetical protein
MFVVWALTPGAVSAESLPLGSLVGLNVCFKQRYIAIFAAFGAAALIAAAQARERYRKWNFIIGFAFGTPEVDSGR